MTLFLLFSLRSLAGRRLQTALCLGGIALGVAIFTSVNIANESAIESFRRSVDTVAGKATHDVSGSGAGQVDEELFVRIASSGGVVAAAPVLEQVVTAEARTSETLVILGVDPFLDRPFRAYSRPGGSREAAPEVGGQSDQSTGFLTTTNTVILSAAFASRQGLAAGDSLRIIHGGRQTELAVGAVADTGFPSGLGGSLAVMDIAAAQELFGKVGRLDRIDLISPDETAGIIAQGLPEGLTIARRETRTQRIEGMTGAFQMNLAALSLLTLLVGAFLIYNTMSFAVVQRRRQIGICRALGMTPRQIFICIMLEAFLLGLVGSAVGAALGWVLSTVTLAAVTGTIDTLFTPMGMAARTVSPGAIAAGMVMGIVTALAAALAPAREAARVSPRTAMARHEPDRLMRQKTGWLAAAGLGVLILAVGLALYPTGSPIPGFLSAFAILTGFAFLTPAAATLLIRLAERPVLATTGMPGLVGVRNILSNLSRTSPAIAALMAAVAMTAGVGLMVGSFRKSLNDWIAATLRADVYIGPAGRPAWESALAGELVDELSNTPGVEAVDLLTRRQIEVNGVTAHLAAVNVGVLTSRARHNILDAEPAGAIKQVISGGGVLMSETLARSAGLRAGMTLDLPSDSGLKQFPVAGVYRDYSADGGQLLMDRKTYETHWRDAPVHSMALYLGEEADAGETAAALRAQTGGRAMLTIRSNAGLRREIGRIFDSTFAITAVLRFLTILVAVCGIAAALLALLVERVRELGTLRCIGMSRGQLIRMLAAESAAMGLLASVIGLVAGWILSVLLIRVVNVRSFGWTIEFHGDWRIVVVSVALAVGAALAATVFPAWRVSRLRLAEAIREE